MPFFLDYWDYKIDYQTSESARDLIVQTISSFGLDPKTMIKAWIDSLSGERYWDQQEHLEKIVRVFSRNLKTVALLEKEKTSMSKTLQEEFGIHNFGRYPLELLHRQFIQRDANIPYGIVILPREDHNGVFYDLDGVLQDLFTQIGTDYGIRVTEVSTAQGLVNRLTAFDVRYGSQSSKTDHFPISFGILGGHGTAEEISFSSNQRLPTSTLKIMMLFDSVIFDDPIKRAAGLLERGNNTLSKSSTLDISTVRNLLSKELLGCVFEKGATVILDSCSTGGERIILNRRSGIPIAQMMAEQGEEGDLTFIAPTSPAGIKSIRVSRSGTGRLTFSVVYAGGESKHFQKSAIPAKTTN